MENKENKQTKSPGQSMVNNINCIPGNKYNAAKAKYYLSRLKELSGRSEQSILVELVFCGFESSPSFASYRKAIVRDWESSHPDEEL